MAMGSAAKRQRNKTQREATRDRRQMDPEPTGEEEDLKIFFKSTRPEVDPPRSPSPSLLEPPVSPGELDYGVVLDMVQQINSKLGLLNLDNDKIRSICDGLLRDYQERDRAFKNLTKLIQENMELTKLVRENMDRPTVHQPRHEDVATPHPIMRPDLIDSGGNLCAADIGITWQGSDMFLHGVKVVGPDAAGPPLRPRLATSTPYQPVRECVSCDVSTPHQPPVPPTCLEIADTPLRRNIQENRPGYRPPAPIQWFNNKSLNWLSWFRHFKAVADVHGWDKGQRALQLVSYIDETAMNVVQELGDDELHDYDVLVKLLRDRFDPASCVSASRSRFHGRLRRHHEDADVYADAITDRSQWTGPGVSEPTVPPSLQQMFALAQRMGYEMRPIATLLRSDNTS